MGTPEGRIKAKLRRALREFESDLYTFAPVQTGLGATTLDYLGCLCGKFIAIETKADASKKLTPRQLYTAQVIREAGGAVFIVFDQFSLHLTIEELRRIRQAYGKRRANGVRVPQNPDGSDTADGDYSEPVSGRPLPGIQWRVFDNLATLGPANARTEEPGD